MNAFKNAIEGLRLSSVVFVEDYLQLVFDDYVLTVFVWPAIRYQGKLLRRDNKGYADVLASLIGRCVVEAVETADSISVLFDDGGNLSVSLREEDKRSAETATFNAMKGGCFIVW